MASLVSAARNRRGLSQSAASHLAGLSRPFLSQIELGVRSPGVSVLAALRLALNLTPAEVDAIVAGSLPPEREAEIRARLTELGHTGPRRAPRARGVAA